MQPYAYAKKQVNDASPTILPHQIPGASLREARCLPIKICPVKAKRCMRCDVKSVTTRSQGVGFSGAQPRGAASKGPSVLEELLVGGEGHGGHGGTPLDAKVGALYGHGVTLRKPQKSALNQIKWKPILNQINGNTLCKNNNNQGLEVTLAQIMRCKTDEASVL